MPRQAPDSLVSEPFDLADSASHLLHRVEQLAQDRFAQLVGDVITLRQFTVLAAIEASPGLKQSDLVRATSIDRSTLADLLARMEKRGWVDRTTSLLDARAQSVHLSDSGRSVLSGTSKHARAADAAILDALPRTKRKTFLNILAKLSKLAAAEAEKAERKAKRRAKMDAKIQKREQTAEKRRRKSHAAG